MPTSFPPNIAPLSLSILFQVFANLEKRGVTYGLGAKAPNLMCDTSKIHAIDCSGWVRYGTARATLGKFILPDGSQNQLDFFIQKGFYRLARYQDILQADPSRLFVSIIKPFENGCGSIGHIWFNVRPKAPQSNSDWISIMPVTLESHGGHNHRGIDSRPWDYATLLHQVYATFELPTIA